MDPEARCPDCGAEAIYRYGRLAGNRQRYRCIVCGRQFVTDSRFKRIDVRPDCPACGSRMHVYLRTGQVIRFRCARYPKCRTYVKTESPVDPRGDTCE